MDNLGLLTIQRIIMNPFTKHTKAFGPVSCILLAILFCVAGCTTSSPDPLAGWKVLLSRDSERLSQDITTDYRTYINGLPSKKHYFIDESNIWFFEDGTGQHAVKIAIPYNGTWLEHILIYDKGNKRIRVIRYSGGQYRS
jgi:hypothetical protein